MPPHYTWNAWAIGLDSGLFNVGITFISSTTVIPAFVNRITHSELIVGLASGMISGAWLLPQLIIASAMARTPRKKPTMVWGAWVSRAGLLGLALAIWLLGERHPLTALGIVLAGMFCFFVLDAVVSIPWFDLLAKVIPARRRGMVLGLGQAVGGIGGIGVGLLVSAALREGGPLAFPANYAALFAAASVILMLAAVALTCIREPDTQAAAKEMPSMRQVLKTMPRLLAQDRPFMRLMITRVLAGFVTVASAFYVLNATQNLGLGAQATGMFVSAQVAGSLTAGLLMGAIQGKWGPLTHIRVIAVLAMVPPIIALITQPLAGALGQAALYPYLALYFFMGLELGSIGWPFFNWVLEYAPETWRPIYIGLLNTFAALVMLAPTLGGWIAGHISYPAVFALSLTFATLTLGMSFTLPNTRHKSGNQLKL